MTAIERLNSANNAWVEPTLQSAVKSPQIVRPSRAGRKTRNFTNLGELQKMQMSKFMKHLVKQEAKNDHTLEWAAAEESQ